MYPNIVDKGNAYQILDAFIYSSDKKKVKEFIED
jgi:hypothetical protein